MKASGGNKYGQQEWVFYPVQEDAFGQVVSKPAIGGSKAINSARLGGDAFHARPGVTSFNNHSPNSNKVQASLLRNFCLNGEHFVKNSQVSRWRLQRLTLLGWLGEKGIESGRETTRGTSRRARPKPLGRKP